jgi:hypothetical protein
MAGEKRSSNGAWITLLFTVIGGVIAIVSQYYTSQFQFASQVQLQKIQGQREVFARLMAGNLPPSSSTSLDMGH